MCGSARLLALQRLNQRSLLAADVGAGAPVHVHIKVIAAAACVAADIAFCIRLLDGTFQVAPLIHVLATGVRSSVSEKCHVVIVHLLSVSSHLNI